ncbi:MAG TPA: anthranilate synthase component I family protein [Verrucomicrobiota bacterium]|nr:anthranilate synthase component I family protein [Verrucomicrobiota bacterium]
MKTIVKQIKSPPDLMSIAKQLWNEPGFIFLLSGLNSHPYSRYSLICRKPFLEFSSRGSVCKISTKNKEFLSFGNPFKILEYLFQRYKLPNEIDLPFPLGGAFGYWGYDLKNSVEERLTTHAKIDNGCPDCKIGFYDSIVVYDHYLNKAFIISTGLNPEGVPYQSDAIAKVNEWLKIFEDAGSRKECDGEFPKTSLSKIEPIFTSTMERNEFIHAVEKAKKYINAGDIYQVNLSHRIETDSKGISPFQLFINLRNNSPAPFSAFMNFGGFQIVSSSPELFLKMIDRHIITRPIKGTRPRSKDPQVDIQMLYELKTSPKETAELVMITDLLRNDLGKVCEYGGVKVSELLKAESHPHIYHLISTVEGELRTDISHIQALASCFPGGSITGAPKIRAMEIIDELEPTARGIYTGTHGYIGFNSVSQISITIRTALINNGKICFQTGAGIVADSDPESEYNETLSKAKGFFLAMESHYEKRTPQIL